MPKKKSGKNKNIPITCGLVMPISSIDSCTSEHWVKVKSIITEAIEGINDPKFKVKLVSDADEIGVIQQRIVQNVSSSEIIVCDVSGKNPNVMFELGMRLAFDKPTVIVKDDKTDYSFDTGIIEHIPYPRDLEFTEIVAFKTSLANKVRATHEAAVANPDHSTFLKFFLKNFGKQNSFEYDKHGVLWLGGEKNIALRVVTFLGMLEEIAKNIPNDAAKTDVFLKTGRKIGCNFGKYFKGQIYPTELKKLRNDNAPFDQLTDSERLKLWTEYDSSTGWGLISEHHIRTSSLDITATHPTLFDGIGGEYFSYMMVGYAESVVNEITSKNYVFSGKKNIIRDILSFSLVPNLSVKP